MVTLEYVVGCVCTIAGGKYLKISPKTGKGSGSMGRTASARSVGVVDKDDT